MCYCSLSGKEFMMFIGEQECTVGILLEELYTKAAAAQLWSLVRHAAGMLHKRVEDLGPVSSQDTSFSPYSPISLPPFLSSFPPCISPLVTPTPPPSLSSHSLSLSSLPPSLSLHPSLFLCSFPFVVFPEEIMCITSVVDSLNALHTLGWVVVGWSSLTKRSFEPNQLDQHLHGLWQVDIC